jgi:hypothetical protein
LYESNAEVQFDLCRIELFLGLRRRCVPHLEETWGSKMCLLWNLML